MSKYQQSTLFILFVTFCLCTLEGAAQKPLLLHSTYFSTDSVVPGQQDRDALQELFRVHDFPEGSRYTVIGYADTSHNSRYNLDLSHQRAEQVKALLITQGVEASQIEIAGRGEASVAAEKARRVDVFLEQEEEEQEPKYLRMNYGHTRGFPPVGVPSTLIVEDLKGDSIREIRRCEPFCDLIVRADDSLRHMDAFEGYQTASATFTIDQLRSYVVEKDTNAFTWRIINFEIAEIGDMQYIFLHGLKFNGRELDLAASAPALKEAQEMVESRPFPHYSVELILPQEARYTTAEVEEVYKAKALADYLQERYPGLDMFYTIRFRQPLGGQAAKPVFKLLGTHAVDPRERQAGKE